MVVGSASAYQYQLERTALMHAARSKSVAIVLMLVEYGANKEAVDKVRDMASFLCDEGACFH